MNEKLKLFQNGIQGMGQGQYSPSETLMKGLVAPDEQKNPQDLAAFMTDEEKAKVGRYLATQVFDQNAPPPDAAVNMRLKALGIGN